MTQDYVASNREDWNREAERYQERHRANLVGGNGLWGPVFGVPGEAELKVLGDVNGKDILELGCGGGQWAVRLARQGARVIAQDISDVQIELARKFAAEVEIAPPASVEFRQGNAEDLGEWGDGSFDIVFSNFGAVGFVDIEACFREVARVLKPGGTFAFSWLSPFFDCLADEGENQLEIIRPYFDRSPMTAESLWLDGTLGPFPGRAAGNGGSRIGAAARPLARKHLAKRPLVQGLDGTQHDYLAGSQATNTPRPALLGAFPINMAILTHRAISLDIAGPGIKIDN